MTYLFQSFCNIGVSVTCRYCVPIMWPFHHMNLAMLHSTDPTLLPSYIFQSLSSWNSRNRCIKQLITPLRISYMFSGFTHYFRFKALENLWLSIFVVIYTHYKEMKLLVCTLFLYRLHVTDARLYIGITISGSGGGVNIRITTESFCSSLALASLLESLNPVQI